MGNVDDNIEGHKITKSVKNLFIQCIERELKDFIDSLNKRKINTI